MWKEFECPVFDGILYPDGCVTTFDGTEAEFKPDVSDEALTFLAILEELTLPDCHAKIVCGESSAHGSDGFIAMVEEEDKCVDMAFLQHRVESL